MQKNRKQSEVMRRQAAKVSTVALEAQVNSVKAEDVLMRLEDRDARRANRLSAAVAKYPAAGGER